MSKTPGPDVISAYYYKKFHNLLIPNLKALFNYILKSNTFPDDMLMDNMSLIPKLNKNHTLPQNYRPISVINNDLKLFGRLLADRLSNIITSLISSGSDQTGFIPTRQINDNIRLASNVIQDADLFSGRVLLLSLDFHKAFDSVLWPYLELILMKFGFRGAFVHGFRALYHHPRTCIKLSGCNSEYFTLGRGTR